MGRFGDAVRRGVLAWLAAAIVWYLSVPGVFRKLDGTRVLEKMSYFSGCVVFVIVFYLCLYLAKKKWLTREKERWGILLEMCLLAALSLRDSFTWPFFVAVMMLLMGLAVYAEMGWNGKEVPEPGKMQEGRFSKKILIVAAILFFLFVSVWTVCRVWTYWCPSFDFGIFSQMFYRMKETGLPETTIERDGVLSHLKVHMSFIYYLILPVYRLFPYAETLQICQAGILASGVIPLWLLARRKYSGGVACTFGLLLLFFPAYAGGAGYDIHENAFLTPLLLWLFWAVEEKKKGWPLIFSLLVCMVKEDAPVYVAVFALYLIGKNLAAEKKDRWELLTGSVLMAVSLSWFFVVTGYLANVGDGVMTYRYKNFMFGSSKSLLTVIAAVILCPMKVIYECVDGEKLQFIAFTLLPLMGLPFWTRRYERYLLLIPYLLVNLMSDYTYQHNIFFQYTYGSTAFLIYLSVLNFGELTERIQKMRWKYFLLGISLLAAMGFFGWKVVPKAMTCSMRYIENRDMYREMAAVFEEIPEEASVAASTFYTTPLSKRMVLYDVDYASTEHILSCEYVVLNPEREYKKFADKNEENGYENLVRFLEENGYYFKTGWKRTIIVYQKE